MISDICFLEFFIARLILRLEITVKKMMKGMTANMMRVRVRLMLARMENAPMNINTARKRFSGPWWASSDTSHRSVVSLESRSPVL